MFSSALQSVAGLIDTRLRSALDKPLRSRPRRLPFRPTLEVLERRVVLASDTIAGATILAYSPGVERTVEESIETVSDVDIWGLQLAAGTMLTADVDARDDDGNGSFGQNAHCSLTSPPGEMCLDSMLRLFDSNGTPLRFNDDGIDPDSLTSSRDSVLSYTVRATGTYYIGVSSYRNSTYDPNVAGSGFDGQSTGPYQLELLVTSTSPTPPTPSLSISDASVTEGGVARFTVSLSHATNVPVTIVYSTSNGTAQGNSDFVPQMNSITFQPSSPTSQVISVPTIDDDEDEPTETFLVTLVQATNAVISDHVGQGTILDNDDSGDVVPTIRISDVQLPEGNTGLKAFPLTVTLSSPSDQTIQVNYATADGSATVGDADYVTQADVLTFSPGQTSKTITVQVRGDTKFELNESFLVLLSNPLHAVIADDRGVVTVANDDAQPTVTIQDVAQNEADAGHTPFTFTVRLSNPSYQPVTVMYATEEGTATALEDYIARSGGLVFMPGQTQKQISIDVVGDDDFEPDETFFVNLTNVQNGALAAGRGMGRILNDDVAPRVMVSVVPDPCDPDCDALLIHGTEGDDRIEIRLVRGNDDDDHEDDDDGKRGRGGPPFDIGAIVGRGRPHDDEEDEDGKRGRGGPPFDLGAIIGRGRPHDDDDDDDDDDDKRGRGKDDDDRDERRSDTIVVIINGQEKGRFEADGICRLIIHGHAGDDRITIGRNDDGDDDDDHFPIPAWVYGGEGDDFLQGGRGHDVLIGGDGDDHLQGGHGRDLLIGGDGEDQLEGGPDDDILLAGTTAWDDVDTALCLIMKEWTSSRSYVARVKNLRDGSGSSTRANEVYFLNAETTFSDTDRDKLTGASGRDWYFANYKGGGVKDKIAGRSKNEFLDDFVDE